MLRTIFVTTTLLAWVSPATVSAEVAVDFTSASYGRAVVVRLTAGSERERTRIPAGTRLTPGSSLHQDLVLGKAIEVELAPREQRSITWPAFCVHSSRQPPADGSTLRLANVPVDPAISSLLAMLGRYTRRDVQAAIWTYVDRRLPDERVAPLLRDAGLAEMFEVSRDGPTEDPDPWVSGDRELDDMVAACAATGRGERMHRCIVRTVRPRGLPQVRVLAMAFRDLGDRANACYLMRAYTARQALPDATTAAFREYVEANCHDVHDP